MKKEKKVLHIKLSSEQLTDNAKPVNAIRQQRCVVKRPKKGLNKT